MVLCFTFLPLANAQKRLISQNQTTTDPLSVYKNILLQYKDSEVIEKMRTQSEEEKDKEIKKFYLYKLIKLLIKNQQNPEEYFQKLIALKTNLQEYVLFDYAHWLRSENKLQEAKQQLEKILDLSPNIKMKLNVTFEIAQIQIELKKFGDARNLLYKVERKNRREEIYPKILVLLAKAEKGTHNQGGFCRWIKKLYTQFPSLEEVQSWGPNLSKNIFEASPTGCSQAPDDLKKRIKSLQWAGLENKALQEIEELQKNAGKNYETDRFKIYFLLHEGEVTKALDVLLPYYEQNRNSFGYLMLLASAAARAGEMQTAVGSYYSAYKLSPRSKLGKEALYQAAFMSYQFQDYDGSARKFKEFIKVYPGSGLSQEAQWHLAWIRYLRADYEGAIGGLSDIKNRITKRKRNRVKVTNEKVNYWLAMSYLKLNQLEKSRILFTQISKDPFKGFYSIAALQRIKKIDQQIKTNKKSFQDLTLKLSRYSFTENLMITDELSVTPNGDSDSEDGIDLNALKADFQTEKVEDSGEIAATEPTEGKGDDDEAGSEQSESSGDNEQSETVTSFANPVLEQRFIRARDLMILEEQDWAKWDLYDIERKTSNKDYLKSLMQEYNFVENYNRSAYIAQVNFGPQRGSQGIDGLKQIWEFAYPQAFQKYVKQYAGEFDVPNEFIWGIMRAESQYKRDVISPVGALGLMQVMPNTGIKISQLIQDKNFKPGDLLKPEPAIKVGAKYLQRLMKRFDSNIPLAAAGYNAGPHRVKTWLYSFGNLDLDEFIEHIPFLETRNYVKKVVSNIEIYSYLYGNKKDFFKNLTEPLNLKNKEPLQTKETWEDI